MTTINNSEKVFNTIKSYKAPTVITNIEERAEDIKLIVKYEDHGDEFIYVRTKAGEEFRYGFFLNYADRNFDFIKTPEIHNNLEYDSYQKVENHACSLENKYLRPGRASLEPSACVNLFVYDLKKFIREAGTCYDLLSGYFNYKEILEGFVKKHNLENDPDIQDIISDIPWTSSVDGIGGVAGKIKVNEGSDICGDTLLAVWANGEDVDLSSVYIDEELDDDCHETFYLPLDQFEEGFQNGIKEEVEALAKETISDITEWIESLVKTDDMHELLKARSAIDSLALSLDSVKCEYKHDCEED